MGQKVLSREPYGPADGQDPRVNDRLRALFLLNMDDAHEFELAGGEEGELK
jgi:hypothetical protein